MVLATTTMSAVLLISLFIFICIGFSSLSCLLNATSYFHACAQTSTAVVPDYSRMSHSFPEVSTDDSGASRSCSCGLGVCSMYRRFTGRKLELYFQSWCQYRSARASRRSESRSCFLTDTEPLGVAVVGCGCDPVAATPFASRLLGERRSDDRRELYCCEGCIEVDVAADPRMEFFDPRDVGAWSALF